jgi:hypothetical protein
MTSHAKPGRPRLDPFAKRPNAKCDPYGQGGRPLDLATAQTLQSTVHKDWQIVEEGGGAAAVSEKNTIGNNDVSTEPILALVREFIVTDTTVTSAARLGTTLAAVAQIQNHFPTHITIERRIARKGSWQVVVKVRCHTTVLKGLSTHDFHLAMVRCCE